MIILGREFAVSGLRLVVATKGVVLPAFSGQAEDVHADRGHRGGFLLDVPGAPVLLWIAVGITIVSGIDYFFKAQKHLW